MNDLKAVRFLGWFSLGLGIVETVAPGALGRYLGYTDRRGLLRSYGLRELAAGVGLLGGGPRVRTWLWGRVGGDALDLATLAREMPKAPRKRQHRLGAMAAVAGITALDLYEAVRLRNPDNVRAMVRSPAYAE